MVVYLLLALEDAVGFIAYQRTHGMSHNTQFAVSAEGTLGSNGLGQFGNLVDVAADVGVDVPRQTELGLVAVAGCEFPTYVLHLAGIDPLGCAFAHGSDSCHRQKNVGGLLVEPVETAIPSL